MGKTTIEWTDRTWNPIIVRGGHWGCTKVSDGCFNCYASRMNVRFGGQPYEYQRRRFDFKLHMGILNQPRRIIKPTVFFVCSVCDLFHRDVPASLIGIVFQVMRECPQHLFLMLTKRPERLHPDMGNVLGDAQVGPIPDNAWLGTSAENQRWWNHRVPILLQVKAPKLFVSAEPLLGPIDGTACLISNPKIDWLIVGGESGPGARPMHPDWARSLRDQSAAAGVPFFFKQWGNWIETPIPRDKYSFFVVPNAVVDAMDKSTTKGQNENANMSHHVRRAPGGMRREGRYPSHHGINYHLLHCARG